MGSAAEAPEGVRLRDYARVVWGRKWVVIATAMLMIGLALGKAYITTPLYRAEATLIYSSPLNVANPFSGSNSTADRETELSSAPSIILSPDVAGGARTRLTANDVVVGYSVSAGPSEEAAPTAASTAPTVTVTAVSPGAAVAARAANAYAEAFVEHRKRQEQQRVREALQLIRGQIDGFTTSESRNSAEYYTLIQRFQDLQILEVSATGNFRVLVPARVPDAPFSPVPLRDAVIGLAAGLALGIGLALLLEQFDTRVRTQEAAAAVVAMPVIGSLPWLSRKVLDAQPLPVNSDSRSPMAEAIRKVRGNLEFANVDGDLKALVVTSALQHEGKSLMSCNLALSIAATGRRVLLVDGDLRRPQVHVFLDLPNAKGVSTVLTGRTDLQDALMSVAAGPRLGASAALAGGQAANGGQLCVLTSGPIVPDPAELVASRSFASLMAELRRSFDLVIVDSPAVLAVGDTADIARSVDGLILLVALRRARRPVLQEAGRQVGQMPCRKLGLVVVRDSTSPAYEHRYYHHTATRSGLDSVAGGDGHAVPSVTLRN